MKGGVYPEYQLALLAAKLTGRPVKWIGDRSESFLSDEHCRDNITEAELALDKNGKFLAIRVRNYCQPRRLQRRPTAAPVRRPTISACSPAPIRSRPATSR